MEFAYFQSGYICDIYKKIGLLIIIKIEFFSNPENAHQI